MLASFAQIHNVALFVDEVIGSTLIAPAAFSFAAPMLQKVLENPSEH